VIRLLGAAARSHVFANLLMILLVGAGIAALRSMNREMFPEFAFDQVVIRVLYPGATPAELEEAITIKVEEAVRGEDGVRTVESVSSEGLATVTVEIDSAVRDPREALVDIRNAVDRITTFPDEAEEPEVTLIVNRRDVMTLVLAGDVLEESLTEVAGDVEEELLLLPEVSYVDVSGVRPYEITAAVREADLQRYGLTFADVSEAIARASLDLPLGKLRSAREELLLRVESRRVTGRELAAVPVVTRPDGTRVLLGQLARVEDAFDEDEERVLLDGDPAVILRVQRTSSQDTLRVAEAVRAYVERRQATLPPAVELAVWTDESRRVADRLSLLSRNGLQGLALVFCVLLLFLGTRLSFWVAVGLPVAFMTALALLSLFGGSLNMISSFALIMILGILVDDSIVVGENIARHMREGGYTLDAAVRGLAEVSWPVIASVTTTVVAFMPLLFIDGIMGKFIRVMPVAVVACLIASLVECLLILPAHLAHGGRPRGDPEGGLRGRIDGRVAGFVDRRYGPTVDWALRNRYLVWALATAFLIVIVGLFASGRPGFVFFPRLDSESLTATLTMPQGTALDRTEDVVGRIEAAAVALREELPAAEDGAPIARRVLTRVGQGGVHAATVELELARSELRGVKSLAVLQRWKAAVGEVPAAQALVFGGTSHRPGGRPIEVRLLSDDPEAGGAAALELKEALAEFPGVFNVDDNLEPGKRELLFALKPAAEGLGVREADLAGQLYAGFSGREVHELQRGRDEVEVRVRYEAALRETPDQLAAMRIRTPGGLVPLTWAADIERDRGLSRIERRDGRRVVTITGDVDDSVTNANDVVSALERDVVPGLAERFPAVEVVFGGQQEEQRETITSLLVGFVLALFGIYAILSLLFESYIQAVIVMLVIPVGFAGAVLGHVLVGLPIMIFSIFGMVGLTGIVVNDALVLIDFVNRRRAEGMTALEAAARSGRIRFRAVFLTTVTTVAGLLPILLERSLSAQFVIPMALSIASGVATATVLTLYVVPALYLIVEDVRGFFVAPPPAGEGEGGG